MRRVWRLGQQQPVKVIFPIYADSMESAALALMGRKMQAALLLYGDNAASAITDEAGGSGADFAAELAARILAGDELSSDGINGLLKYTIADEEAGPVWESLDEEQEETGEEVESYEDFVRTWESWIDNQANYITRHLERATKRRNRKQVPQHQLSLFSTVPNDNGQTQLQTAQS